jgi:tight adherence protein B
MLTQLIVAALVFAFVGGLGYLCATPQGAGAASKRAKQMAAPKASSSRRRDNVAVEAAKRRATIQDSLKDLSRKQQNTRKSLLSIKGRMVQAGLSYDVSVFWIASGILGAVFTVAALVLSGGKPLIGLLALPIFTLGVPRWILGMLIKRRQKKFGEQLAEGIDIIVRGVKSGLPLQQCLGIIAQESPEPLKGEFKALVDGQMMGVPLEQNLQRMYERMPLSEANFFGIVLNIQQKTGGNLSESLGNLSNVLRSRKLLRENVKALSSEAKASAMIIGALPFLVMAAVSFIKPDYMAILFTTPMGKVILLGAALMMGTGIFVMRQMINFKF